MKLRTVLKYVKFTYLVLHGVELKPCRYMGK